MHTNDTSTRPPLFERLKSGLEEGIEFTNGNVKLRTIVMSNDPPDLDEQQITVDPDSEEVTRIERGQ